VIPFDLVCGGVNAQHNMNYVTDHICMYLKYMTTFDFLLTLYTIKILDT
jgi:hypothetical protein